MIGISYGKRGKHKDKQFIDITEKGDVIDTRHKETHSREVDGNNRFCGHRFVLKTKLYGDKRCLYCGKWFHWKQSDAYLWIQSGNIDTLNVDDVIEPLHCGSDHCQDYHQLSQKALIKRAKQIDEMIETKSLELYRGS